MQKVQRSKEAAQFEEWERQEDNFHLDQARLRSHIRIQDGRGKNFEILDIRRQRALTSSHILDNTLSSKKTDS